jgi:hypothetical protein
VTDDDLYRITVISYDVGGGHIEITLAMDDESPPQFTAEEVLAARRHVAGVLGRLGSSLATEVFKTARAHDCDGDCSLYGIGLADLASPDGAPSLSLCIPAREKRRYAARLREMLGVILADTGAPSS